MSELLDLKRRGYYLQRSASLGATITLVSCAGYFCALFECAKKCAEILGDSNLQDTGDGILEVIPVYKIAIEDINLSLQKLTKRFSVALVEYTCEKSGGRFVPIWRINRADIISDPSQFADPIPETPSTNLDDY